MQYLYCPPSQKIFEKLVFEQVNNYLAKNHKILLKKLELYCVKNTSLRWFTLYLRNRNQVCKVGRSVSKIERVTTCVPRGSNLGTLLSLLYIRDLPNCLHTSTLDLFADDTNLTVVLPIMILR